MNEFFHEFTSPSDDSDVSRGYHSDFQASPNSETFSDCYFDQSVPKMSIIEEPADYRYRYAKEKYHGHILGESSPQNKKKDSIKFPAVQIHNYDRDVIVRCWLIANDFKGNPKAHFHKLNRKLPKGKILSEPHDIHATQKNDHIATFDYMYIVHAVEKDQEDLELYKKKKSWLESGLFDQPNPCGPCDYKDDLKSLDKNQSVLLFQAFDAVTKEKICESRMSRNIKNLHNPITALLKIVNYSLTSGSCEGGDEVFMFFEKISKDVEVRVFFEEGSKRVWEEKALYNQSQIHHQCGVVFKTPPFMNTDITSPCVAYFELYRKNDGERSVPVPFTYLPRSQCHLKDFVKKRPHSEVYIKEDPVMVESPSKKIKELNEYDDSANDQNTSNDMSDCFLEPLLGSDLELLEILGPASLAWPPSEVQNEGPNFALFTDNIQCDGIEPSGIRPAATLQNIAVAQGPAFWVVKAVTEKSPEVVAGEDRLTYIQNLKILENLTNCIAIGNLLRFEEILKSNGRYDINSVDFGGNSIFLIACSRALKFVKHLLKNGKVNKNITNLEGDNALLVAVKSGQIEIVKELLTHNFDANVQNYKSGETPLHAAVLSENLPIVKILIEFDANPVFENWGSGSPYDYSLDSKDPELRNYIRLKAQEYIDIESTGDSSSDSSSDLDSQLQNLKVS